MTTKFFHIFILSLLVWGLLKLLLPQPKSIGELTPIQSGYSGPAKVDPITVPTGERIEQPTTKVSELYPEYNHRNSTSYVDLDNSVYIGMLDWSNDEYWEIQELNGKYYRVLKDGAFEELDIYEEYEYEEEIGDIEDLYRYAQDNKHRIIKAINKGY